MRRLLRSKHGFELSVNFLVMLILSVTMFGIGLYLLGKIAGHADELNQSLDRDTQEYLKTVAMTGKIALYPETAQVSTGSTKVVGFGIKNVDTVSNFKLKVILERVLKPNEDTGLTKPAITDLVPVDGENFLFGGKTYTIEKNAREIISVPLTFPVSSARKGRYIFSLRAYKEEGGSYVPYEGAKLLQITVT